MIVTFELSWTSGDVINGIPTKSCRVAIPAIVDPVIASSDAIDDIPSGSHFFLKTESWRSATNVTKMCLLCVGEQEGSVEPTRATWKVWCSELLGGAVPVTTVLRPPMNLMT